MKNGVRTILVFAAACFLAGFGDCNRGPVASNDSNTSIAGYRIEGTILDEFLRPLAGVQVLLTYDLAFVSGDSINRVYSPLDPNEIITVEVKDNMGQVVRLLHSGPAPVDSDLNVTWDGRDNNGNLVRSGVYMISYTVASSVRKSYQQIVDGNLNATTDSEGKFTIPEPDLPVGEIAAYYNAQDAFDGQYEIANQVFLRFVGPSFSRPYQVALSKNMITSFSKVLN